MSATTTETDHKVQLRCELHTVLNLHVQELEASSIFLTQLLLINNLFGFLRRQMSLNITKSITTIY